MKASDVSQWLAFWWMELGILHYERGLIAYDQLTEATAELTALARACGRGE